MICLRVIFTIILMELSNNNNKATSCAKTLVAFAPHCQPRKQPKSCPFRTSHSAIIARFSKNDNNQEENDNDDISWLDRPFFDPDAQTSNNKFLSWLAHWVREDYDTAEALYVGIILVLSVIVTQELLRMQLYGDHYVPFVRGGAMGGM